MRTGILINVNGNLEARIRHMAELGFCCGQLSVWDMDFYTAENAKKVQQILKTYNFEISSVWCGWSGPMDWGYPGMYSTLGLVPAWLRAKRLDELCRGGEFADILGVDTIVTHTGYISDDPLNVDHVAIIQSLKYLCQQLKNRGQRFAFETGEELPLTLRLMIDEIGTGNAYVNFDPANLMINARANPLDAMDLLGDFVVSMHGKDAVYPKSGAQKGREMALGQGNVDFRGLIGKLKERNFDGDIYIEREIPEGTEQDQDILSGKRFLDGLIEEVCK